MSDNAAIWLVVNRNPLLRIIHGNMKMHGFIELLRASRSVAQYIWLGQT
ncbi:hypothetical protein HMPREF3193_01809 [Bifidobacterium breve]|nr:hypothetical protein HMPREF3193_01809 [Bifidobacterium breve]